MMDKNDLKDAQKMMLKLKGGGFFVYYLDKKSAGDDTQGHNILISKKVAEASKVFKESKKLDSKIARGTFFYDSSQSKFLFGMAKGDPGRVEKGLKKLASKGAPVFKKVIFVSVEELKQRKAELESEASTTGSTDQETTTEDPRQPTETELQLLRKMEAGEELSDDEVLQLLALDIDQEIVSEFDQDMLDDFLSPDLDAEADLSYPEAFERMKSELLQAKVDYDKAVRAIYGGLKGQVQSLRASLTDDTAPDSRRQTEETIAVLKGNRDKIKSAVMPSTAAIEDALDRAGGLTSTRERALLKQQLEGFIRYIREDEVVQVLRAYPEMSMRAEAKRCLYVFEKIDIQVDIVNRAAQE